MSHVDSLDEETKRILAEVDSNDSKESDKPKIKNKNTDNEDYDENDNDPLNDKSMDDKEW